MYRFTKCNSFVKCYLRANYPLSIIFHVNVICDILARVVLWRKIYASPSLIMNVIVHLVNTNYFINIFIINNHLYMMVHINYVINSSIEWGNIMMLEFSKVSIYVQYNIIFPLHIISYKFTELGYLQFSLLN